LLLLQLNEIEKTNIENTEQRKIRIIVFRDYSFSI